MRYRIFTSPRTRASYYLKALWSVATSEPPEIPLDFSNEPYNNRSNPEAAVDWMLSDENAIVKHHVRHIWASDVYNSAELFEKECTVDWYNILLLRRDLFAQGLSYARSRSSGQWDVYTQNAVWIDPELFENSVLAVWGSVNRALQLSERIRYDQIIWSEDLTGVPKLDVRLVTNDPVQREVVSHRSPGTVSNIGALVERSKNIELPEIPGVDLDGLKIKKIRL